jgi:hypothetical protein
MLEPRQQESIAANFIHSVGRTPKRFGTGPVIRPLKEEATVRHERSP